MIIAKEFSFDAAHQLTGYQGKCANLHGHTYTLQVLLTGKVQANGLVYDFVEVSQAVKKLVITKLDHTYLNDTIAQPSAENIAIWIWEQLSAHVPLFEIRLWESPTNFVIYRGPENEEKND